MLHDFFSHGPILVVMFWIGACAAEFRHWHKANKQRVLDAINHYRETDPVVEPRTK